MKINISEALKIDGWMHEEELEWLANQASKSKLMLEIGSYRGRSARAQLDNTSGILICVDPHLPVKNKNRSKLPIAGRHFAINTRSYVKECRLFHFKRTSDEAFPLVRMLCGQRFDYIFIDGDHSYEHCLRDIDNYIQLVKPGGLLSGHDYSKVHPGVIQAVDERFSGKFDLVKSIWSVRV